MKIEKFKDFLFESKDISDLKSKLSSEFKSLKINILEKINKTVGDEKNIVDIETFISDYISTGKESTLINDFVDDNDIFNFYISNQTDIDKHLIESGYLNTSPKKHNVFSLYDVVIDGTKQTVLDMVSTLNVELFKKPE